MKFYNALGPNPRLVRMFLAEKGMEIPDRVEIDILPGDTKNDQGEIKVSPSFFKS